MSDKCNCRGCTISRNPNSGWQLCKYSNPLGKPPKRRQHAFKR